MSYAYDFNDPLPQKKPKSLLEALKSDATRTGVGIINALSSIPRFVQSHQQEYKPGMSVADMPQTMEVLPEAASTATMLPATTGVASVPGISLASGFRLPPKVPPVKTYHGTGSPAEYSQFKLPPPEHDLGIHTTINPNVSSSYAYRKADDDTVDFMSGMKFNDPNAAYERIKPVLTDVQAALKFPGDAIKWNEPGNVLATLEAGMRQGHQAPRGLLSDFKNISSSDKMWQDQFVPMLKDRGYDSLLYPHFDSVSQTNNLNTFMAFDPKQVIPMYSREGQELIKKRGVIDPTKGLKEFNEELGGFTDVGRWKIPRGILKESDDVETLRRSPTENTRHWWEDPKSPLSKYEAQQKAEYEANMKKIAEADEKAKAFHKQEAEKHDVQYSYDDPKGVLSGGVPAGTQGKLQLLQWEQDKAKELFIKGILSKEEYKKQWHDIEDKMNQAYGNIVNQAAMLKKPKGSPSAEGTPLEALSKQQLLDKVNDGSITGAQYYDTLKKQMENNKPVVITNSFGWPVDAESVFEKIKKLGGK